MSVDKGSETGEMWAQQGVLRYVVLIYALKITFNTASRKILTPDLDERLFPPCMAVKSVHNITAESLWKWLSKTIGRELKTIILEGRVNGVYNPNSIMHK